MPSALHLSAGDRPFFHLVAGAIASNPFGEERAEFDRALAGAAGTAGREDLLAAAVANVARRLEALVRGGRADIRRYAAGDRELLQSAVLFNIFHRHIKEFDQLILKQAEAGDTSCPVPFAPDVLRGLAAYGLTDDVACRFLAEFYQLRRAFYFIHYAASGRSPCMQALRRELWNNVFTCDIGLYDRHMWDRMEDFSTLLLGETGTGKGTAALAIGRSGFIPFDPRKQAFTHSFAQTFVSLNLSQFPESLIESELFGHRKGAFTGAVEHHEGVFARCSPHGAIFLDEIGDVSIPVQIKLLQVLQERTFSPVGSHEKKRFHGRVVAATNKPLRALREAGRFRDDFYYRLCSDQITVPPLRQRLREEPRELDDLIEHILRRLCGGDLDPLKELVRQALEKSPGPDYAWPGNVRELEQATRRILLRGAYEGDTTRPEGGPEAELIDAIRRGAADAQTLLSLYAQTLFSKHGTYEAVAERMGLDWRTAKKHIEHGT